MVGAGTAVEVAVPGVGAADGGVGLAALVDGQMERDGAVASGGIGEEMSEVATLGDIEMLIPVEAATSFSGGVAGGGLDDGEAEGVVAIVPEGGAAEGLPVP